MNIQQIKLEVSAKTGKSLPVLTMVRQLAEDNTPTAWLSHWDNDNRIRVSMHEDIFNQLKANPTLDSLAVKKQDVPELKKADGTIRASYTRFVVITPKNIEGTF